MGPSPSSSPQQPPLSSRHQLKTDTLVHAYTAMGKGGEGINVSGLPELNQQCSTAPSSLMVPSPRGREMGKCLSLQHPGPLDSRQGAQPCQSQLICIHSHRKGEGSFLRTAREGKETGRKRRSNIRSCVVCVCVRTHR